MIYYFLYELLYGHFKEKDWFLIKALNVFQYVTFRTAYASITALLLSLLFGGALIRALKGWNIGQQIREEGPQGHMAKRGTPTMGGVLIVGSVLISTLLWARLSNLYIWTVIVATVLFAAIGFMDDYAKMAKQRSLGLNGQAEVDLSIPDRIGRLDGTFYFDQVPCQRLFLECQHPVFEGNGGALRRQLHRPVSLSRSDHHRLDGLV